MRFHIFTSGLAVLALGFYGTTLLPEKEAIAMLHGVLTLGGAILICGFFSLKMQWHGIIGAGVIALLGAARGIGNLPDFIRLVSGDPSPGPRPALEFGFTLVCLMLLVRSVQALLRERTRRLLEPQE